MLRAHWLLRASLGLSLSLSACAVDTESTFDPEAETEVDAVTARHVPVCRNEGTAREGWYWQDTNARALRGECSGQVVQCAGIGTPGEGWFVGASAVALGACATPETARLTRDTAGLYYPSESDYPFDVLQVPGAPSGAMTQARLRAVLKLGAEVPIDNSTVDAALAPRRFEEHPDAMRFEALRRSLRGYRVYRVGTIQVHYYFVKVLGGQLVGLHTVSIET
ncbi:MAG: hypothetical protein JNK72_20015 [Myxococcales bacterium]|nr:hypothetical protein [Myxococcales bacterium]